LPRARTRRHGRLTQLAGDDGAGGSPGWLQPDARGGARLLGAARNDVDVVRETVPDVPSVADLRGDRRLPVVTNMPQGSRCSVCSVGSDGPTSRERCGRCSLPSGYLIFCLRLWRLALGALTCGSGGHGVVVGCIMHSCALLVLGPRSDQDKRGGVIRGGGQLQSWLPCGRVVGRWTNGS
jgi:hypothetical protein